MSSTKRGNEFSDRAEPSKQVKVEGGGGEGSPSNQSEAEKAAEAAAAIAARLAQQYNPKPPVPEVKPDVAGRDFEFFKDIEINDLRNRYLLTKGPTQQQILADTGAAVLTKGVWYPDKSMATDKDPALYLHISAESQEKLDAGIKAVEALIARDLQPLVYDRSRKFEHAGERDNGYGGRRKWDEEKVPLEFEPLRNFNVRAKTVGPGGLFVKWIQQETQTRVQIKGIGSGYIETETGMESQEPIHIAITGPDRVMIDKAKEYAQDLVEAVREKHAEARQMIEESDRLRLQGQGGGGYGQGGPQYSQPIHYPAPGQESQSPYNYQANQYSQPGLTAPLPPGEAPPPPPGAPASAPPTQQSQDAATAAAGAASTGMTTEQWSAYWNSLDPASQAYYTQYYAAYAAYGSQPQACAAAATASPYAQQQTPYQPSPAPPSSAPPPPPPSEGAYAAKGGSGAYGAVPPPPGL
ncbi:KH domain-containing protein [Sporobolomyces salmoneus]|uniref:KH domain-containing protein n=1 Tax=Sporobolomyces salmoneus TaxID=183962 RepID=UPI00317859AE